MEYEWDESKSALNLIKHGLDFDFVHSFDWETAVIFDDVRFNYGEERQVALGFVDDRLYAVTFTKRNRKTRIISMRKANDGERKRYENSKKTSAY